MQSKTKNLIVVIDDDEIIRQSTQQILRKSGYAVETYANGHEGIERLKQVCASLLVVDIKMPELDGFGVIKIVRKIDPDLVIVVITGYATVETAVDAMRMGAYDFLPKPFTPNELRLIIERGIERWHLVKEAQRLRQEKDEVERKFVTLVSHQLKGPLTAVKQYLDVLLYKDREQLPQNAVEWISRSQVRLGEMLTIIQDWLTLGRLEHGALCDRSLKANLPDILDETVREHLQLPSAAGITITQSICPGLPPVCGDRVSLSMLLQNILNNAVKYNRPGGSVRIEVRQEAKNACIEVRDTGYGIPADCIPHLFEEFYRVRNEKTQDIPGTGLGLVICKKIATELGGSISVSSKQGEFTSFTIRLPLAE